MRNNTLFTVAALGFIAYTLFRQASRIMLGSPYVSYLKPTGQGIEIRVKMPVLNRSDFTARIEGFLGVLKYKSNILGPISLKNPADLPQRATAEPEFSVMISYGSIATEIWDFLQKKLGLFNTGGSAGSGNAFSIDWKDFRIVGTIWVSGLAVDVDESLA